MDTTTLKSPMKMYEIILIIIVFQNVKNYLDYFKGALKSFQSLMSLFRQVQI